MHYPNSYVVTLSCPDRPGIVAAISGTLAERGWNITDSAQFGDPGRKRFFLRTSFAVGDCVKLADVSASLQPTFERFDMSATIHDQ
jgi:formyltetrahydrofolate deformylase